MKLAWSRPAALESWMRRSTWTSMDNLGITKRGTDENGKPYYPYALVDGYISRIGEAFLRYINDPLTRWCIGLGAPYGTTVSGNITMMNAKTGL